LGFERLLILHQPGEVTLQLLQTLIVHAIDALRRRARECRRTGPRIGLVELRLERTLLIAIGSPDGLRSGQSLLHLRREHLVERPQLDVEDSLLG
jgi:hypothetical protein